MAQLSIVRSLAEIDPDEWNRLAGSQPFVRHEYLSALHESGCASRKTGWDPIFLVFRRGGELVGSMPLYLKSHSRGEYVFDFGWAEAFERSGIAYYPKLISAIPFTPVTGSRILAQTSEDRIAIAGGAIALSRELGLSSLHILFPSASDLEALRACNFMLREGIQFHWNNNGYGSFEEFLESLRREKRKKLRQDRRRVVEAGITFKFLRGSEISSADVVFFHRCYVMTYMNHGSAPYLSEEFFRRLHRSMPDSMVLVLAVRGAERVACALNVLGADTLYGRYWGSLEFISGLHFEACYCQAIEYCIQNRIEHFEGGAQGSHKLSRGLLPTPTWSAHWISDTRFSTAIGNFLREETRVIEHHFEELELHTPFKVEPSS